MLRGEAHLDLDSLNRYFRLAPHLRQKFRLTAPLSSDSGYFSYGSDCICYGRTSKGFRRPRASQALYDVLLDSSVSCGTVSLPFDIDEVITSLSHEKYMGNGKSALTKSAQKLIKHGYYAIRPVLPLGFRSYLQKFYLRDWQQLPFPQWPVDTTIDRLMKKLLAVSLSSSGQTSVPFIWFWPEGTKACAVMTHDVEQEEGRAFCSTLMDLNDELKIPASFQVVPEKRYTVTSEYLEAIKVRGFEVAVQDLNHDGRLFWEHESFRARAEKINQYGREWGATGFRAAILYRNPEWLNELDFQYDMSTPNVAHLDPQRGGCCTVMPYFIGDMVELPVTTSQDHSVFHILKDYSLDLWKRQIAVILKHNGLASFIIHPDYIIESRARAVYVGLLNELNRLRSDEDVWVTTPGEINRWWRNRDAMKIERRNNEWVIEGPDKKRARVAYASLRDGEVEYSFQPH